MTLTHACRTVAPGWLCQQGDIVLYLAPVVVLALVLRMLAGRHPIFFVFTVAGTICHELAHFCAGLATGAQPGALTIIPRRQGRHWQLGSVTLHRVRWYNAAPAALAPLAILALPVAVAWWRTAPGWHYEWRDGVLALLLAPQLLSFWPSAADWRIAVRSWPYLLIIAPLAWLAYR